VTSAVFHYLGPSLAVLLFVHVQVLGVAWLRIASAAVVFAIWRRPWRLLRSLTASQRWVLLGLGTVLAAMNSLFYLALARLPLDQRTVIVLHFYLDLPLTDAAAILDVPIGTAKSRLHRGLETMRTGVGLAAEQQPAVGVESRP